jgi:CheY-like chemotaxis protein
MKRVLLVDDDSVAVDGLCSLLEMDGFDVTGLVSPEEALLRLKAERFDVLITDLEMPRVHGLEVVRAARAASTSMKVLVVTAYMGSRASATALSAGAARIFSKPLRYELLIDELGGD